MRIQGKGVREWEEQETWRMRASQSYWSSSENFIQEWQYKHKQEEAPREEGRAQGLSEGQVAIFSSWNQWSQCPLFPQTFLLLWPQMFSQDCLCKLENIHKAMAEAMAPGTHVLWKKCSWPLSHLSKPLWLFLMAPIWFYELGYHGAQAALKLIR